MSVLGMEASSLVFVVLGSVGLVAFVVVMCGSASVGLGGSMCGGAGLVAFGLVAFCLVVFGLAASSLEASGLAAFVLGCVVVWWCRV